MQEIPLTQWQLCALSLALLEAIRMKTVHEKSGKHLLDLIESSDKIIVQKA